MVIKIIKNLYEHFFPLLKPIVHKMDPIILRWILVYNYKQGHLFYRGDMFACFHTSGTLPCDKEKLKRSHKHLEKGYAISFKIVLKV